MKKPKYTTDPNEVYTLELQKLQRFLTEIQQVSADTSTLEKIGWRHVEHVRQANFMLAQALQLGNDILKLPG